MSVVKNIKIIYSEHNIDSCLAASLVVTVFKAAYSQAVGDDQMYLRTQPYDWANHTPLGSTWDVTYLVGVTMMGADLINELECSGDCQFIDIRYQPNPVQVRSNQYREYTPLNIGGEPVEQVDKTADMSISSIVCELLQKQWDGTNGLLTPNVRRLVKAAAHYVNFRAFGKLHNYDDTSDWDKSNVTPIKPGGGDIGEMALLYSHFEAIRESASTGTPLKMVEVENPSNSFAPRVKTARDIIKRNMLHANYSTPTQYSTVPTATVGEEMAIEVMRQMSYPYDTVITYEDVKNRRLWRVYSTNKQNIDHIRRVIKPTESWVDCAVHYMLSAAPTIDN